MRKMSKTANSLQPRRTAFSLLELVAVVTLIGIVAAISMIRMGAVDKRTAAIDVLKQAQSETRQALERYRFDHGEWPEQISSLASEGYKTPSTNRTKFQDLGYSESYSAETGAFVIKLGGQKIDDQ